MINSHPGVLFGIQLYQLAHRIHYVYHLVTNQMIFPLTVGLQSLGALLSALFYTTALSHKREIFENQIQNLLLNHFANFIQLHSKTKQVSEFLI